jgi:hypothetical protein
MYPAKPTTVITRLEFMTKHFAVLSATITIMSIVGATLCLYFYLSIFDASLIWLVQYSDILQFSLISLAVVSSVVWIAEAYLSDTYKWAGQDPEEAGRAIRFALALAGLGFASLIIGDELNNGPIQFHVLLYATIIIPCVLVYKTRRHGIAWLRRFRDSSTIPIGVAAIALLGSTFGLYVRDVQDTRYDVTTKTERIENVNIVISLGRATVLYDKTRVTVIPESELQKIVRVPASVVAERNAPNK